MKTSKELFVNSYSAVLSTIIPEIVLIPGYQNLFAPHIPGVGEGYWSNESRYRIAFVGKDVGIGRRIGSALDDIETFVLHSSDLMNEKDILNWNLNYGQFASAIVHLLSVLNNVTEEDVMHGDSQWLLSSFVWAQRNAVWNFKSSEEYDKNISYENWLRLNSACKPLDNLDLLISTTDPDIIFLSCWDINGYLNPEDYNVLREKYHLRLLKSKGGNKYIIHTCHQTHWKNDYEIDPFYSRLREMIEFLRAEKIIAG